MSAAINQIIESLYNRNKDLINGDMDLLMEFCEIQANPAPDSLKKFIANLKKKRSKGHLIQRDIFNIIKSFLIDYDIHEKQHTEERYDRTLEEFGSHCMSVYGWDWGHDCDWDLDDEGNFIQLRPPVVTQEYYDFWMR